MNLETRIIERYEDLPAEHEGSFFHSRELFRVAAATSGHRPLMAVALRADGSVAARLLACIRRRGSWFPPYLFTQGRIFGEGDYAPDVDRDEVFGLLLQAVTSKFKRPLCLYVEFSNISQKMFGYKQFREQNYFPVSWQEVHQSLHGMAPEERLDEKTLLQIRKSREAGVVTRILTEHDDPKPFYQLLRAYYRLKPRKFVPSLTFFEELLKSPEARLCLTEHNGKAIGCCVLVFSSGNAYLWFMAAKRMSQASLHPDTMTVWNAIQLARQEGCRHIYFMDAGLPFQKSNYRDFILKFGGKPVAKYRWFRFSIKSLNKFLAWLYRE